MSVAAVVVMAVAVAVVIVIIGLFNDIVSSSEYIALNDFLWWLMNNELGKTRGKVVITRF